MPVIKDLTAYFRFVHYLITADDLIFAKFFRSQRSKKTVLFVPFFEILSKVTSPILTNFVTILIIRVVLLFAVLKKIHHSEK